MGTLPVLLHVCAGRWPLVLLLAIHPVSLSARAAIYFWKVEIHTSKVLCPGRESITRAEAISAVEEAAIAVPILPVWRIIASSLRLLGDDYEQKQLLHHLF